MKLIHPIYLDVNMLVSFAAAIDGGLSLSSEITSERGSAQENSNELKAEAKFSNLFASFFNAGVSAGTSIDKSKHDKETKVESRSHTESSIAILLYDKLLKSPGALLRPKTHDDFKQIEPGSLVELYGTLKKNAVDAMIEYLDVATLMSGKFGNSKDQAQKTTAKELDTFKATLEKDRNRTPLSNLLMKCHTPENVTASITLRRENLRDLTFSELHNNSVRLVGKVTRVIDSGSSMSAFENYGLSILNPKTLSDLLNQLSKTDGVRAEFSEVEIQGPAVQILPLMIFV